MVPNNRAAHLFIFSEFVPPTRLIWHYITVHKNTYRTRAIISRGLYIFYLIFKDHFFVFKEVF